MVKLLLLSTFFTITTTVVGQATFNSDYSFPEGVYLSHASLLANQPDLEWESIDGEMVQLPEDFRVQIAGYGYKDERINQEIIPYAISLEGEPYLFIRKNEQRKFHEFAGFRVKGLLSVLQYDTTVVNRQLMQAFNPINGQPFRQAYVEREKTISLTKILHLRTGALMPFTHQNLVRLCSDDQEIARALIDVNPKEAAMMLRALKLYDDRHPLTLPIK
ncbi:hypothetical protein [Neolewinella persica]|uniref:hypothetical protein n=1 Tax=Neolewinella persica TaxID=70998 RepID=UPI00037EFD4F|nr:hypothetical protein [Neolewinella persica]